MIDIKDTPYIKQFEFVRIFFALFVFIRTYYDLDPLWFFAIQPTEAYVFAIFKMAFAFFILIGFFTPLSLLLLLLIQLIDRSFLGASTLGDVLMHAVNVILFLGTAGLYYSIDNKILNNSSFLKFRNILLKIYNILGSPKKDKIDRLRFLGSYTYAFAVLAAGIIHLYSSDWMTGRSIIEMYSSNYNSKYGDIFKYLFTFFGSYTYYLIVVFTWILTAWQIVFVIGISFKKIKKYFIYFGIFFHVMALLLMNLGWLIPFTLLLYTLVYFPLTETKKSYVIYDDKCGFCERSIKVLFFIDLFNRVEIVGTSAISNNFSLSWTKKISNHKYFQKEILGINEKGSILYGADLYLELFKKIDLLKIFLPLYYVVYKLRLADYLYKYIAKRRIQISKVCGLYPKKNNENVLIQDNKYIYNIIVKFWSFWLVLSYISFLLANILFQKHLTLGNIIPYGTYINKIFAITTPDVFNENDTFAQQGWIEIYDHKNKLIPFYGKNGERLKLHESRVAYFSTIGYRRDLGKGDLKSYEALVKKVIKYYEFITKINEGKYQIFYSYRPSYDLKYGQEIGFKPIKRLYISTCKSSLGVVSCESVVSQKEINVFLGKVK